MILTVDGKPALGPEGQVYLTYVVGAPNDDAFGTVTVWTSLSGPKYFALNVLSALPGTYTALRMLVYGSDDGGTVRPISWDVPSGILEDMQAGTGDFFLGTESEILGDQAGMTVEGVRFVPRNATGEGACAKSVLAFDTEEAPSLPSIGDVEVTGTLVAGETLTAVVTDPDGFPAPTLTYQWYLDGTPEGGETNPTYTAVEGEVFVRATATNASGAVSRDSDPVTVVAAGSAPTLTDAAISGTGVVGSLLTVSYTVAGDPTPSVALQWQMDGANVSGETSSTFTPSAAGTASCEIVATNIHGSANAEPTKTVTGVTALTASQWSILTVAAATDVNPTARRWTKMGVDPTKGATKAYWTTSAPEFLAINFPGNFPAGFVEMTLTDPVQGHWDPGVAYGISASPGTGNVGNGIVAGGRSLVTGPGTITLTATSSASFSVTGAVSGTATVGTEFLNGNYRFTIIAGTTAFAAGDTFTLDVGTWDFSVFDPDPPGTRAGDTLRQARVAVVYAVNGVLSPLSEDVKTVPAIPVTATNTWYPYQGRSPAEYAAGIIGGEGKQIFRHIARTAADPALALLDLDVNGPVATRDSGGFYYSPQLRGMSIQESGAGVWIDPTDADRWLLGVSGGDMRSATTTPNAYDNRAGLYLSTDGGATATHVQQLTNVPSCGASGERDCKQLFCHLPGGTPEMRTIYYLHKPRPKGGSWGTGRLYLSTDGGTSWAPHGENITNAKYGNKIYWIDADPSGNLYIGADSGLFKSTDGGSTFTACTGIAGSVTVVNAYHGGTNVWAARDGNGAYQATNAAGTTFVRNSVLGAYDIQAMAVCPADATRIVVAANPSGTDGKWSHNGGASWSNIVNRSSTGDTTEWGSKLCGNALISWTPGSRTEIIVQRKQHFGISRDGGASTDWSGNGTDYQTRKWIGVDPSDWQVMVAGTQDTITVGSTDGQNTEYGGGWTTAERTTILNGGAAAHGHGGLVLRNGSHRVILSAAGGSQTQRLLLKWTEAGANPVSDLTIQGTARSGCFFSGLDAASDALGWIGKNRVSLSSGGVFSVEEDAMQYEFYGATSTSDRIIGGPTAPGNARTLYVSTNGGDTWGTWGTSPVRFASAFGTPQAVCVSRHHANRVWVGESYGGTGRIYKMEGSTPTNTLIWTLADWPGFDAPETSIHVIRECPSDPTILYALAFAAGNDIVFRITDALTTPVVENITYNLPLRAISWMHVHPLTEDVITAGQCGSRILRCHDGSTAPNAGALFDRVKAYVDAHIGPGVEF